MGWSRYSNIFGKFTLGMLPSHVERAEERFTVERCRVDESVSYEVFAFARPAHPLAKAGPLFVRLVPRRFAADSLQRLATAASVGCYRALG